MNGRRWDEPGHQSGFTRRWCGYAPPCRQCGRPVFRGVRPRGKGLLCAACDKASLAAVLNEAREGRSLREAV